MSEMLTAKEVQDLLQVDRSTVYRMAEAGKLPAIKVGKQWRFPEPQIEQWMHSQTAVVTAVSALPAHGAAVSEASNGDLATLLPRDCVQLIQDSYADLLGVMLVITDMDGNPITEVSNPCGLFEAISDQPYAVQKCIESWHDLATMLSLEPQFKRSHLGLYCARALIRVGTELKGMVVAGCIAPDVWPPDATAVADMAASFNVPTAVLTAQLDRVHTLTRAERDNVLTFISRIANIVSHIVDERKHLVGRLERIAQLTVL